MGGGKMFDVESDFYERKYRGKTNTFMNIECIRIN